MGNQESILRKEHDMLPEKHGPGAIPLTLMCVVCDREKAEDALAIMQREQTYFSLALLGKGTANSRILSYLGIGARDKTIFFSILPAEHARHLLPVLGKEMELDTPGHGMAFYTSIHEGCYHCPVEIATDESEEEKMEPKPHDLVMVILNRGYTEEVMDVARAAGATGGTVLHARGCGLSGAERFFGVTIQPEREVLMIVADTADSCGIMQAIAEKVGPESDAGAVSFSMPVSGVRGIDRDVPEAVAHPTTASGEE